MTPLFVFPEPLQPQLLLTAIRTPRDTLKGEEIAALRPSIIEGQITPFQDFLVEKTQRRHADFDGPCRALPFVE
jgi:hypothetical protein